jgi:cytochrome c oxidase assembly protein subunit 15
MDFGNAFVLWRGLGVDYEGGVLASPARVAIHFTHRLGAVVAGSILIATGLLIVARSAWPALRFLGGLLMFAVLLQIAVGIAMVHFHFPLALATMHNGGAALLVIVTVTLLRALWPRAALEAAPARPPEPVAGMVTLSRVDAPR